MAVAGILGAAPDGIRDALRVFRGVRRRMEVFLEAAGITFIDDFAHHPTAIRETIAAAREKWIPPQRSPGRLHVLFEPRSNTTVTNRFQQEMREAFAGADDVWIGPIYSPERIPPETRLDRGALVHDLAGRSVTARYTDDIEEIVRHLEAHLRKGDVVLVMSNGAFGGICDRLREVFEKGGGHSEE